MKSKYLWLLPLAILILAAPWASENPDALQKVLGLSGGASPVSKAIIGVVATFLAVVLVMKLLSLRRQPK